MLLTLPHPQPVGQDVSYQLLLQCHANLLAAFLAPHHDGKGLCETVSLQVKCFLL